MADSEVVKEVEEVGGAEAFGDEEGPAIIQRILKLKDQQEALDALDLEYRAERIALENKYREKKSPLFVKRTQFILGACDLDGEPNGSSEKDDGPAEEDTIPMFWLKAMMNHEVLSEVIQERDFGALACLEDVTVTYGENMDSYSLTFHFKENEWFDNETLVKSYSGVDLIMGEDSEEQEIESTKIEWKEGKSLMVEEMKVKQKSKSGKRKGETRVVNRLVPVPSFFYYFSDPVEPKDEEDESYESRVEFDYDQDYEIGESLRLNIVPNAINWFTGEAADSDDEEYGDDDEEDDDDDNDDADSSSDAEQVAQAEGTEASAAAAAGKDQAECKQS
jgi:nucleosome assembly protein 1-like 1